MAEIVAQVQELSPLSASLTLKLVSRHSPNFVPRPLWLSVADGIRQTGSAAGVFQVKSRFKWNLVPASRSPRPLFALPPAPLSCRQRRQRPARLPAPSCSGSRREGASVLPALSCPALATACGGLAGTSPAPRPLSPRRAARWSSRARSGAVPTRNEKRDAQHVEIAVRRCGSGVSPT